MNPTGLPTNTKQPSPTRRTSPSSSWLRSPKPRLSSPVRRLSSLVALAAVGSLVALLTTTQVARSAPGNAKNAPAASASNGKTNESWPRFRGPNGQATVDWSSIPLHWDQSHVLWKVELPGHGNSSASVWKDLVFLTTAKPDGSVRSVLAYDARDGHKLWQKDFEFATHDKHQKNSFATSTPTTDGERVYVTFADPAHYRVYCLTVGGDLVWEKDLGSYEAEHASGASPIVSDGRLFVTNDQDGPSFLACLDAKAGETIWKTERESGKTSYSTPFLYDSPSGEQLIVSSTHGLSGYDTKTGKLVWVCDVFDQRTVGSPVLIDGLVMGICGSGSRGARMAAVRPDGKGDVKETALAWTSEKQLPYVPTPLACGPYVILTLDTGIVRCLEAKSGEEVWSKRFGGKIAASPVLAGDKVIVITEEGEIYVLAADKSYQLLGEGRLDDHFLATPALAGGRVYLRGENNLWCIGNP